MATRFGVADVHHTTSLNRLAASATTPCLTGCAIGEVIELAISSALGWAVAPTIPLAVGLAFVFGYAPTLRPLLGSGVPLGEAARLAFASRRRSRSWKSSTTP